MPLSIGHLSAQTATPRPTIRYYESIGLLPKSQRGAGGQRQYAAADVARLHFIRARRALDFPLAEIARLLAVCGPDTEPCIDARRMAQAQLDVVRDRILELRQTEATLQAEIAACTDHCSSGADPACLLIPT